MSKPVTAASIYWEISRKYSREASFCANVITTRHTSALTRLRGMVRLLDLKHDVYLAQFSTDQLMIDGFSFPWSILELAGRSMKGFVEARAKIAAKIGEQDKLDAADRRLRAAREATK